MADEADDGEVTVEGEAYKQPLRQSALALEQQTAKVTLQLNVWSSGAAERGLESVDKYHETYNPPRCVQKLAPVKDTVPLRMRYL